MCSWPHVSGRPDPRSFRVTTGIRDSGTRTLVVKYNRAQFFIFRVACRRVVFHLSFTRGCGGDVNFCWACVSCALVVSVSCTALPAHRSVVQKAAEMAHSAICGTMCFGSTFGCAQISPRCGPTKHITALPKHHTGNTTALSERCAR